MQARCPLRHSVSLLASSPSPAPRGKGASPGKGRPPTQGGGSAAQGRSWSLTLGDSRRAQPPGMNKREVRISVRLPLLPRRALWPVVAGPAFLTHGLLPLTPAGAKGPQRRLLSSKGTQVPGWILPRALSPHPLSPSDTPLPFAPTQTTGGDQGPLTATRGGTPAQPGGMTGSPWSLRQP